jgi:hypothetical protein
VRRARLWVCVLVCAICSLVATALAAPHIRLKGRAQLDVHLSRESSALVVAGAVSDDVARPLPNVGVRITLFSSSAAHAAPIPLLSAAPSACRGFDVPPELDGPNLVLKAESGGRFCARLSLTRADYILRVQADASDLVDGSSMEMPIDLRLRPLNLRFDPQPAGPMALGLDDEGVSLGVVASIEDDGAVAAAEGIALSLTNETGESLGTSRTDGSGRAQFWLDPVRLGGPGPGELRVRFAGDSTLAASSHAIRIERWTHVDLDIGDTPQRSLLDWRDDAVTLQVIAVPRCSRRGCRGTPTGAVEARGSGKKVLGVAPLHKGAARIAIPTDSQEDEPNASANAPVSFRYIPDTPWFQSPGEPTFAQVLPVPSPWRRLPLAIVAISVIAWLAFLRLPNSSAKHGRSDVAPMVQLVRPAPPSHGWTGRVADAHDGVPVGKARISIQRAGFHGIDVLVETHSDVTGAFALPPTKAQPRDLLVVEGPLHAKLRRRVPPSGEVAVALVLRKRALLDGLVAWARRRGTPYDMAADPTPGHVREMAGSDLAVARWAGAVERAAYSGDTFDEHAQAQVDILGPQSEADDVDATDSRSV